MLVDFDELVNRPVIDAFGQTVTVRPAYGASYVVQAIFRRAIDPDLIEPSVIVSETYLSARTVDVSQVTRDDLIEVGGVTYRAAQPMPEDKGMTRIPLRAAD